MPQPQPPHRRRLLGVFGDLPEGVVVRRANLVSSDDDERAEPHQTPRQPAHQLADAEEIQMVVVGWACGVEDTVDLVD